MVENVDLEIFEARHGRALMASVVEQCRFAFLLSRLRSGDASGHDARLWSAGDGTACALLCRGTLLLGDLDSVSIDTITEDALVRDLRRIAGAEVAVDRARKKCAEAGLTFSASLVMRTMVLRQKPVSRLTNGRGRPAELGDFACIRRWLSEFHLEALPHEEMPSPAAQDARCGRLIDGGGIVLWEHEGAPVSMAAIVQDLPEIAAISLVYTPPSWRGQGYAGAAVSFLSDGIVASGRPACLFVDVRNPISSRCYAKVGYVPAAVHAEAVRVGSG